MSNVGRSLTMRDFELAVRYICFILSGIDLSIYICLDVHPISVNFILLH